MCVIACEDGCSLHSDEVHEAIRLLRGRRPMQSPWASAGLVPGHSAWTLVPMVPPGAGGISWPAASPAQELVPVPVAQQMQDSEILSIYVKFLSQFTASLDGHPDASNPYLKYYVPFCVNSQLLVHVAIYSAACFLTDTGHVERTVAMAHKGRVIKLLNEHIRSQLSASDEAIAGVVQLVVDECSDVAIALSFEVSPFLQGGSEFEFRDNVQIPLRLALNTPFISTLVAFSSCDDALRIHPAVASILDDMRFLLATVLALPETPSAKELHKVHTTSAWIHERISSLPEESPAARRPSAGSSTTPSRDSPVTDIREGQQQAGHGRPRGLTPQQQSGWPPMPVPGQAGTDHLREGSPNPGRQASPNNNSQSPPPAAAEPPDHVYQAVRLAALLYSRAIMRRRPFSEVVLPGEFLRLWTTAWRVPLSTWRSLLGVLAWILLPILPSGKAAQPHDRLVKAVMNITLFQIGMDNWEIGSAVMAAGLSLQRWLAGGAR
ncbi:b145e114-46ea-418d-aa4b-d488dc226038 [Thermothielavioides terrestris]|uniref:B145e114-46ea-418d-aa4b-d488dc226038 n=1 Tax=Thermothielavioides terrestris TaxID=2587410 RepID=A0A446BR22_9PEZI|nr:b145e114-46ea-418d-aa4b-d488dc226038 [Thermothielavioides terrestris]